MLSSFPTNRPRRLRQNSNIRRLVEQTQISTSDLVMPLFVCSGTNIIQPIISMPGQNRYSPDELLKIVKKCSDLRIPAIALFPQIDSSLKCNEGKEAYNSNGLIPKTIRLIKKNFPDMLIVADIALDPYTSHGQDGIIDNSARILNDKTNIQLCKQALVNAEAGADTLAPSDMMDGRIGQIRNTLDGKNLSHISILSYSAKFASNYYGPFRDAVGSATNLGSADKRSYQLSPKNTDEALREVELDIKEGADMVMIKPGMLYLDILYQVKNKFKVPTFVYQVSGEYSMISSLKKSNHLQYINYIMESLIAFKRAGADGIFSYFSLEVAEWLKENHY